MDNNTLQIMSKEAESLKMEVRQLNLKVEAIKAKLAPIEQILVAYGYKDAVYEDLESNSISYTDELREYINSYRGIKPTINNREFESFLEDQYPDVEINKGSLGTAWRMLLNSGDIKKIKRGSKSSPAIYAIETIVGRDSDIADLI